MDGLLEGVSNNKRVQVILICWTVPLLIGSFAFVVVVLPDVRHAAVVSSVVAAVDTLHINKFLFVFAACLVTAVFLQLNRLPLWRILEGYVWPDFLRKWRIRRAHAPQCRWLQARLFFERAEAHAERAQEQLDKATKSAADATEIAQFRQAATQAKNAMGDWLKKLQEADRARRNRDRGRKYPKGFGWLPRRGQPLLTYGRPKGTKTGRWTLPYPAPADSMLPYPDSPGYPSDPASMQIMPTLLGNAMRVMETYGANNYGLDSQIMWFDLLAEAPASVQATLEEAQLEADTLVCAISTAYVLACTAAAGGAWRAAMGTVDTKLWVTAAVSFVVALVLHRRLLNCVDGWASAIKTLVNSARAPLREKYGLRRPSSAEDEKRMWEALTASIWYGSGAQQESELAKYRQAAADSESAGQATASKFRRIHQALYWLEARMAERP